MKSQNKPGWMRLLEIAGTKRWKLMVTAIFAIFSSLCALTPYVMIYLVAVKLLSPEFGPAQFSDVTRLALWAVAGVLARFLLLFISSMFSHVAAFDILYGLRSALTKKLGELPMGYFSRHQSGEIKTVLSEDVEEIEQFVAHHIPDLVSGVALPVLTVVYLFTVDWRMALVALVPLPIALVLQYFAFGSGNHDEMVKAYHDSLETMNGVMVEYVRGMPVVKVFNQSVDSFSRLKTSVYAYRDFVAAWTRRAAPPWAAFTIITTSSLFFILPAGIGFYRAGTLPLTDFLLFLMLGSGYMVPLLRIALMGGTLSRIAEGVVRLDRIMNEETLPLCDHPKTPESFSLAFENVHFGYGENRVLKGLDLKVEEGSVTALVGPSGAGKSTMAQLLLRMWEVDEGAIRIGGVDIREMEPSALMNTVGFVLQDAVIFSDSIYENIRMGMDGVSESEVIGAAQAAQCMGFIEPLEDGIHTLVGEGSKVHLSGGEMQRIAMARVILKNAPIVVLDEATAYADAENEARMQEAFSQLMKNKTVIVIAHRLSTITDADAIAVVKGGVVEELGTHDSLLAQGKTYADMWEAHMAARSWKLASHVHSSKPALAIGGAV